eukprot:TRINITY_DN14727_c0_g1_i2.p1 TRINITY_DN14727_c0_g1~~TRINITY_DN14727_c0_g1_i2.p1  ORF type:complete len:225 (+),score=67.65 TRINITY_DN14727_c0_g1_i2:383-1057(+)
MNSFQGEVETLAKRTAEIEVEEKKLHYKNMVTILFEELQAMGQIIKEQTQLRRSYLLQKADRLCDASALAQASVAPIGLNTPRIENNDNKDNNNSDDYFMYSDDEDDEFIERNDGDEEIATFKLENQQLARRQLQSDAEEIRMVEARMLEITRMMSTVSTQILDQHEEIEHLFEKAQESHKNMEDANISLQKANQSSADSRICMLLFLLGASFILLFNEWYSEQ